MRMRQIRTTVILLVLIAGVIFCAFYFEKHPFLENAGRPTPTPEPEPEPALEPKPRRGWRRFWRVLGLLLLLVLIVTLAWVVIGRVDPDWVDSLLYSEEELEILRY